MSEPLCEWCGRSGVHPECREAEAATQARAEEERAVWARFGFEVVEGPRALDWQRRVFSALDDPTEPDPSRLVLENDAAVFIGHGFVGSCGCLLRKADGHVFRFGSYCPAYIHLWGFMMGVELSGETRDERSNTLVLSELADRTEAIEKLKDLFTARSVRNEIIPALERGESVTCDGLDLYFGMAALYDVERSGAFRFEIRAG